MKGYPKRIYLSATWKGDQRPATVHVANLIANYGVTVVRDHESNKTGDPKKATRTWVQRVASMMRDCSGLVVVLPFDKNSPQTTSPFLIPELLIADNQDIPILLFANPGVTAERVVSAQGVEFRFPNFGKGTVLCLDDVLHLTPDQGSELDATLMDASGFALSHRQNIEGPFEYPNSRDHRATSNAIEDFLERCSERDPYPFVFNVLPFSLKDSVHLTIAREVYKATGMACHISLDGITGEKSVRRNWQLMLQRSDLVIAELSSLRDACLFEVGCAIGWDKCVYVLSKKGQQSLPFGLDDQSFHQYSTMEDLETFVREICCRAHRREVFNLSDDLQAKPAAGTPGIPSWFTKSTGFTLDSRLTVSIWSIFLSLAFALQILALLLSPKASSPNVLAVVSALSGFLAWTRVNREFWEKRIGKWLSWLPWVGMSTVAVLLVLLLALIFRIASAAPQVPANQKSAVAVATSR